MLQEIAILNNKLVSKKDACVPIDDIAYTYGFGVYESLKVRKGKIYFKEKHVKRLLKSAKIIGLEHDFNEEYVSKGIDLLLKKIEKDAFNIKMMLIGDKPRLFIFATNPRFVTNKEYSKGVKLVTYNSERFKPKAKSLSMLESYIAYKKARKENAYDSLFVNKKNEILEGTRTNLFFTDGETIFTIPEEKVLSGVTRENVILALKEKGIEIKEKSLKKNEIEKYSFFITSTSIGVLPINQIDDIKLEIKSIVQEVRKIHKEFENNQAF
jgi:branched-chain amino acid aminotransferase